MVVKKTIPIIKILLWIGFSVLIVSCGKNFFDSLPETLSEKIYVGSVWINLEVVKDEKKEINATYGDFQLSSNFFYLRLKNPFGVTLGIISWEISNKNQIKIYDFLNRKIIVVSFSKDFNPEDLPWYVIGAKEKEKIWEFSKGAVFYRFDKEFKEGEIKVDSFRASWEIKNLKYTEKPPWDPMFYQKNLEKEATEDLIQL